MESGKLNHREENEQAGRRPVLVLSHDGFNDRSGTMIPVAVTSLEPRAGFPLTVQGGRQDSLNGPWIKISQILVAGTEACRRSLAQQYSASGTIL